MPPKPLKELTAVEVSLLSIAARLQAAVKWVERKPPTPEKWAYLNGKVKDELVRIISAIMIHKLKQHLGTCLFEVCTIC